MNKEDIDKLLESLPPMQPGGHHKNFRRLLLFKQGVEELARRDRPSPTIPLVQHKASWRKFRRLNKGFRA
jgi:hypothetical protein